MIAPTSTARYRRTPPNFFTPKPTVNTSQQRAMSSKLSVGESAMEQVELNVGLQSCRPPETVNRSLIELCNDTTEAIRLSMSIGKRTAAWIADHLSIDRGQFSRIMSRSSHMPTNLYGRFACLTGNTAVQQFMAYEVGLDTIQRQQTRIEKLERELAELKAHAS